MRTNNDWKKWGKQNPYYGVLTEDRFMGKELNGVTQKDFYASGERDIDVLTQKITKLYGKQKNFKQAIDFGSGVGRLSFALTKISKKVTGLDISPPMVDTAREQAKIKNIKNTTFKITDNHLNGLPKKYDLVYSNIVLQHIPEKQGLYILDKLAKGLDADGCFAVQVVFSHNSPLYKKSLLILKENIAPLRWVANGLRSRPLDTPNMRMHNYSLNKVSNVLFQNSIVDTTVDYSAHGAFISIFITGRKSI